MRWAARYAFSDDLWRSKPRVVVDPALERALLSGLPAGEDAEPVRDLVDALLPAREDVESPAWMGVRDEEVASGLSRLRPGTTFVAIDRLPALLRDSDWDVALVDLDAVPVQPGDNPALGALGWLGLRGSVQRSVVVWGAAGEEGGLEYEALADAMMEQLWTRGCVQRIYGLYQPAMAAVVDFGESLELDDGGDLEITLTVHPSELRGGDDADEEVPLYFDNSLGAQEPELDFLLGVCTATSLPDGLGLIELPAAAAGRPSGIRAQLASSQQRAERAEVERQELLDRLDAMQRENRELRAAVEAGPGPFDALARDEALETAMAREQALKWKVSALEHQLSQALARPVEALEAEVARLTAVAAVPTAVSGDFEAPGDPAPSGRREQHEELVVLVQDPARDEALAARLRALVHRLERGGIGVLALRRELDAIARRLRGA